MKNLIDFCISSDYHSRLIFLEEENFKLKEKIYEVIELIENVYNSLENVERPIKFYEKILEILNR